jgi:DNA-binding Lrp family transcriptional regulator
MLQRIKRFMYEYTKNSRLKTKELGKILRISQQSASYLIKSYNKKKLIKSYTTIIDSSKFGLINIIVYYYFSGYTVKMVSEILSFVKDQDEIVRVEQLSHGYDLSCTFCVPNLSHFNKLNRDFLQRFKGKVFVADVFPIVVKHIYPNNYLVVSKKFHEIVICGDRDVVSINEREQKVLSYLFKNSQSSIIEMSNKLNLNSKTIINIKNKLEKNMIIRKYCVTWNYDKLRIDRKQILISTEGLDINQDNKFLEFVKLNPYIVGLTRLIGGYDFLIEVEGENFARKSVLNEIRSEFPFKECKVIKEVDIIKERYIPENVFEK